MKALNLEMKTLNGKVRRLCGGRAGGRRLGLESVGRRNMIIGRQFIGAMAKLAKEFEIKGGAVRVLEATTDEDDDDDEDVNQNVNVNQNVSVEDEKNLKSAVKSMKKAGKVAKKAGSLKFKVKAKKVSTSGGFIKAVVKKATVSPKVKAKVNSAKKSGFKKFKRVFKYTAVKGGKNLKFQSKSGEKPAAKRVVAKKVTTSKPVRPATAKKVVAKKAGAKGFKRSYKYTAAKGA